MGEPTRCKGDCCRRFCLPLSPEEIKEMLLRLQNAGPSSRDDPQIDIIAPMLIFLEKSDIGVKGDKLSEPLWWYTCKHHDPVSGDCKIYATRPRMCSDYPYGKPCEYPGCAHEKYKSTDYNRQKLAQIAAELAAWGQLKVSPLTGAPESDTIPPSTPT